MGIAPARDRVVQSVALQVLEPIFEADFEACSSGFRPGRSAHDVQRAIQEHLTEVCDAELAGDFAYDENTTQSHSGWNASEA